MGGRATAIAAATAFLLLGAPLLAGCSGDASGSASSAAGESTHAVELGAEGALVLADGWAKAGDADGMTSVFGTLTNHSDATVFLFGEGSTSPAAASVEVHEVVDGKMRMIERPIELKSGESIELTPGGHHLMLMGLSQDLLPGEQIDIDVRYGESGENASEPGYSARLTALVKDYAGANEEYGDLGEGAAHDAHGEDGHGQADGHTSESHGSHDGH